MKIINGLEDLELDEFSIEGIFFINTPTFYMFNGKYKAITLKQVPEFVEGKYEYPELMLIKEEKGYEMFMMVRHPYFQKPLIIEDPEDQE